MNLIKNILIISLLLPLPYSASAFKEHEDNYFEEIQSQILNNDKIGKLEINFIYNKLLELVEDLKNGEPEKLIYNDFSYIIEYIEEISSIKINKKEAWETVNLKTDEIEIILYDTRKRVIGI